jgi:hypothetical protein
VTVIYDLFSTVYKKSEFKPHTIIAATESLGKTGKQHPMEKSEAEIYCK